MKNRKIKHTVEKKHAKIIYNTILNAAQCDISYFYHYILLCITFIVKIQNF